MEGLAISLVSVDEEDQLKSINRLLKRDLPVRQVRGFEVDLASRGGRTTGRGGRTTGRSPASSGARAPRRAVGSRRDGPGRASD